MTRWKWLTFWCDVLIAASLMTWASINLLFVFFAVKAENYNWLGVYIMAIAVAGLMVDNLHSKLPKLPGERP